MHTHVLPWTDRPLVTQNLVGGDEGISDAACRSRELIPNPLAVPRGDGRGLRRRSERLRSAASGRTLAYVGRVRGYRDLTEGTNLDIGASFALRTHATLEPGRRHGA